MIKRTESFNTKTIFKNDTYYTFDGESGDIYLSQTTKACDKKYFVVGRGGKGRDGKTLDTAFFLKNLENVTLDFGGAVITLHGKIQPFILDNCKNVTIKNATVAYERSHYTELDVVKHIGNELYTKPKEKFPCRAENGYFIPYADEWTDDKINEKGCIFMQAFDKKTHEGAGLTVIYLGEEIVEEKTPPTPYISHIKVRSEGDEIVFSGELPEHWDERHSIAIEHNGRDISSMAIYHSKDIVVENYRILNGGGMGLYSVMTENITVKGVKLECDELSHGVVTNSADAIHFIATRGKTEITDSVFEGTIDDALNIHSNYYYADKAEKNILYARYPNASGGLGAYGDLIAPGDEIALYNHFTLDEKKRFVVREREILGDWLVKLTLDKDASDICREDLLENLSTNTDVTIKNTRFGKSNGHLRFQTRGKITVENCECGMPMMLTGDTTYWFEASPVTDMTIKNCRFGGERGIIKIVPEFVPTETAPFYHSGIKITGNIFDAKAPLEAHLAKEILFEDNKISDGSTAVLSLDKCIKA